MRLFLMMIFIAVKLSAEQPKKFKYDHERISTSEIP